MENINLNKLLDRDKLELEIKTYLDDFYKNINNSKFKKALYIYGNNGCGKTTFIKKLLEKYNYDIIYYDTITNRNKNLIENITTNNICNYNVVSMFYEKPKKTVIVFDDIYTMNFGDKTSFANLIKFIKKKTKKTKNDTFNYPIICINNNSEEKKIIDLIKVSKTFYLQEPTNNQILEILNFLLPKLFRYSKNENKVIKENILLFLQNNLSKIKRIYFYENSDLIYNKFYSNFKNIEFDIYFNIKKITKMLLSKKYNFNEINKISESDRTTVSLLFHENISNLFDNKSRDNKVKYYLQIIDNFCFSDYIDRVIFQKQIWQVNDISYLIKIFYNNYLLKKFDILMNIPVEKIIFTKILTKYSTEYNNYLFITNITKNLNINFNDLYIIFLNLSNDSNINLEDYEITKLIYQRIIKLINNILYYEKSIKDENIIDDFNLEDEEITFE